VFDLTQSGELSGGQLPNGAERPGLLVVDAPLRDPLLRVGAIGKLRDVRVHIARLVAESLDVAVVGGIA